jgi:hypothetical protein
MLIYIVDRCAYACRSTYVLLAYSSSKLQMHGLLLLLHSTVVLHEIDRSIESTTGQSICYCSGDLPSARGSAEVVCNLHVRQPVIYSYLEAQDIYIYGFVF